MKPALLRPSGSGAVLLTALLCGTTAHAQLAPLERLPQDVLAVTAPEQRVSGTPGTMRIEDTACSADASDSIRRRLVDIAVQEWAFFGFQVVDQTGEPPPLPSRRPYRRRPWMDPAESGRVAAAIAGYWSVTPDGAWILERQNNFWRGPLGVGERWRDPWSAAFVSWAMCESGLGDYAQFRRSINHHRYIDQAIRARDSGDQEAAYIAWDVGEQAIEPGDLLCSARRHGYRSLADRRRHLGEGARTHCDIVVHLDPGSQRIMAIGGNVRGRVSLKLLYAQVDSEDPLTWDYVGRGNRRIFAHLKMTGGDAGPAGLMLAPSIEQLIEDPQLRKRFEDLLQVETEPRDAEEQIAEGPGEHPDPAIYSATASGAG